MALKTKKKSTKLQKDTINTCWMVITEKPQ